MPRIYAKNHEDCYIDCPADGYAEYHGSTGPCIKGCGEVETASSIIVSLQSEIDAYKKSKEPVKSSGTLVVSISVHEYTFQGLTELDQSGQSPTVKESIENYIDLYKEFIDIPQEQRQMDNQLLEYVQMTGAMKLDLLSEMLQQSMPMKLEH